MSIRGQVLRKPGEMRMGLGSAKRWLTSVGRWMPCSGRQQVIMNVASSSAVGTVNLGSWSVVGVGLVKQIM